MTSVGSRKLVIPQIDFRFRNLTSRENSNFRSITLAQCLEAEVRNVRSGPRRRKG